MDEAIKKVIYGNEETVNEVFWEGNVVTSLDWEDVNRDNPFTDPFIEFLLQR